LKQIFQLKNKNEDNKIPEVPYEDKPFEEDLRYINGLVKTSSPNGAGQLELEKVLKNT